MFEGSGIGQQKQLSSILQFPALKQRTEYKTSKQSFQSDAKMPLHQHR